MSSKVQAFGLDISDHSVNLVLLDKNRNVTISLREKLPFGIVNNGNIKDKQFLAEVLIKLKEKAGKKLKTENVILALPEHNIYSHILNVPKSLANNPKVILKLAQENIPLDLNESIFDYKIIEKDKKEQQLLFVAVEQNLVLNYLEVLQMAQLKAIAIDIEPNSIAKALEKPKSKFNIKLKKENDKLKKEKINNQAIETIIKESLPEAEISLDIGAKFSVVTIFYNGNIFSPISIPIGGQHFTKIIQEELKISDFEKADQAKKKLTIKSKDFLKLEKRMNELCDRIIHEITDLIHYFESHNDINVTTLHLSGGSSRYPGLKEYLQENLEINVEKAVPQVKCKDGSTTELFITAAGLALRGISKDPISNDINLLPAAQKKLLIEQAAKSAIIYSSLIILFISSTLLASFNIVLSGLYFDLDGLEKSNTSLERITEGQRYQEIKTHIQELNDGIQVAKQSQNVSYSLQAILKDFQVRVPKTIIINQFAYKNKDNLSTIDITGFALTRDKVLLLQEALETTPFYQNLAKPVSNFVNQKNIHFKFSFDFDLDGFQKYQVEQKIIEAKAQKQADLDKENEALHNASYPGGNPDYIPAFTTGSGNTTTNTKEIIYSTGEQTQNKPLIPIEPGLINTEQLTEINLEGSQMSTSLEEDLTQEDQTIEEIISNSSNEDYPFQEKIHEKVGDVFIIEQNFTRPTDTENNENLNNSNL